MVIGERGSRGVIGKIDCSDPVNGVNAFISSAKRDHSIFAAEKGRALICLVIKVPTVPAPLKIAGILYPYSALLENSHLTTP